MYFSWLVWPSLDSIKGDKFLIYWHETLPTVHLLLVSGCLNAWTKVKSMSPCDLVGETVEPWVWVYSYPQAGFKSARLVLAHDALHATHIVSVASRSWLLIDKLDGQTCLCHGTQLWLTSYRTFSLLRKKVDTCGANWAQVGVFCETCVSDTFLTKYWPRCFP